MTRKFLFCFPLRLGNIIFGYIVIIFSIAVMAYNLYELGISLIATEEETYNDRFRNFENLEDIFGPLNKNDLVKKTKISYYLSYLIIGMLLFIFSALFTCGAYRANNCLVKTFFIYSFFHLFFTIVLIVWEAVTGGWIQLGIILLSDLLLIICLFGVKYLMETIRTGYIYSRPGEVFNKY